MRTRFVEALVLPLICASIFSGALPDAAAAMPADQVRDLIICKSPTKSPSRVSGKSPAEPLQAATSKSANAGKSVRTLRVYETREKTESGTNSEGCRATYSKTNVEQIVGTSRQIQQCQTILSGIQKNLEASNWSCRRAGAVAVLKSSAAELNESLGRQATSAASPASSVASPSAGSPKSVVQ